MRTVPTWIGKTDDEPVPPRVRIRIWEREGGRCWISGRKIGAGELWDLDHRVALCNGGRHAEDNLFPSLRDKHRAKTAADVAEKSKTAAIKAKHLGVRERGRGWRKHPDLVRGVDGKVRPRNPKTAALPSVANLPHDSDLC